MRAYIRDRDPDLREGLVSLLIATFDTERGDIWLISPWLRDIELPVSRLGHFASVFGGHRDFVTLAEVLTLIAQRHQLHVVTKPPDELVSLVDLRRLMGVLEAVQRIRAEEELHSYAAVGEVVGALNAEVSALVDRAAEHVETLRIGWDLRRVGAELLFLARLHAKLLWTPAGALVGSANFTGGGFGTNEELMVEITTPEEHRELAMIARILASRAASIDRYDLTHALRRARIDLAQLRQLSEVVSPDEATLLNELLRWLGSLAR